MSCHALKLWHDTSFSYDKMRRPFQRRGTVDRLGAGTGRGAFGLSLPPARGSPGADDASVETKMAVPFSISRQLEPNPPQPRLSWFLLAGCTVKQSCPLSPGWLFRTQFLNPNPSRVPIVAGKEHAMFNKACEQ